MVPSSHAQTHPSSLLAPSTPVTILFPRCCRPIAALYQTQLAAAKRAEDAKREEERRRARAAAKRVMTAVVADVDTASVIATAVSDDTNADPLVLHPGPEGSPAAALGGVVLTKKQLKASVQRLTSPPMSAAQEARQRRREEAEAAAKKEAEEKRAAALAKGQGVCVCVCVCVGWGSGSRVGLLLLISGL